MRTSETLKCHTNIRLHYKLPWCSTILANDAPTDVSGGAGSDASRIPSSTSAQPRARFLQANLSGNFILDPFQSYVQRFELFNRLRI